MAEFNGMDTVRMAVDILTSLGADKAQASLSRGERSELNVDAGRMSLYRTTVNVSIGMTAHKGGRKGSVSVNRYDEASIRDAADQALAMAESSQPDPANDISPSQPYSRVDAGDRVPDSAAMYDRLAEFVDWSATTLPSTRLEQCVLDFGRGESFYANSNGAAFEERSGLYNFYAMFTTKEGTAASSFNYSGASHRALRLPLGNWGRVEQLMRESAGQTKVAPVEGAFEGDIILTPESLGDFLGSLDDVYMGDYALITGNSPWKDRLGHTVVSPLLTVSSEPVGSRIEAGYSYTGDGFAARNCHLIEAGILRNFSLGLYGSNKTGKPRCPSGGGGIVVEAGTTPLSDMIRDVRRGIILTRFSGGSPSDNGDFSGVAKNSYLVENGKIVRPVSETMVAGNLARLFGSIRAVSAETVDFGSAIMPWVLAGGLSVSGA